MTIKKINNKQLEHLKNKYLVKKVHKFDFKNLNTKQIHQIMEKQTYEEQVVFLFRLVKSYGNPYAILGNDLKSLRIYIDDEIVLEIIAILFIYCKIFTDTDNLKEWNQELKHRKEALNLSYIKENHELTEDHKLNIQNIEGRLIANFIADTVGTIDAALPVEAASERHVIISELFNELDIKRKEPFYTLDEAEDDFMRGNTTQSGKKAISKRIKKELAVYKKMLENTIVLINTNNN